MKIITCSFCLPQDLADALKKMAKEEGRSRSNLLVMILKKSLARKKSPSPSK